MSFPSLEGPYQLSKLNPTIKISTYNLSASDSFPPAVPTIKERIINAVTSCFGMQKDAPIPQEVKKFHANLLKANTTASRIQLYTKFQSHFHSLLKFFGHTATLHESNQQINRLAAQKTTLLEAQKTANQNIAKLETQASENTSVEQLLHANTLLQDSIESAIKETDAALIKILANHPSLLTPDQCLLLRQHFPDNAHVVSQILDNLETTITNWKTFQDNLFTTNRLERTEWTSEASQRPREETVKKVLHIIATAKPIETRASKLLQQINTRYEADSAYQQKKALLNYQMLAPLLEECGLPTGSIDTTGMVIHDAFQLAMKDPALNDAIEKEIEKHKLPGKPIQGPLLPEDLTALISVFLQAKASKPEKAHEMAFETTIVALKNARAALIQQAWNEVELSETPTPLLIAKTMLALQDVLGPHHKLTPEVESAMRAALASTTSNHEFAFFKEFTQILSIIKSDKVKVEDWLKTDGSKPLITDFDPEKLLILITGYMTTNVEQGCLLLQVLLNTLEQKVKKVNSQFVTDTMILALFDEKELREKKLLGGTVSRDLTNLSVSRKKQQAGELGSIESYFADQGYLHRSHFSMWSNSSWEVSQTKMDAAGKQLTSISWKGKIAIPAGEDAIRVVEGTATLDFRPLGLLSPDEQKSALVFAEAWANIVETADLNAPLQLGQNKWRMAIEKHDPALIPELELTPSPLPLRLFLLNDDTYWEVVDGKRELADVEKEDFKEKDQQVLKRYTQLVKVASEFQTSMEKELVKMRSNIGNDETPLVAIA